MARGSGAAGASDKYMAGGSGAAGAAGASDKYMAGGSGAAEASAKYMAEGSGASGALDKHMTGALGVSGASLGHEAGGSGAANQPLTIGGLLSAHIVTLLMSQLCSAEKRPHTSVHNYIAAPRSGCLLFS
jgi:hypothetical protein